MILRLLFIGAIPGNDLVKDIMRAPPALSEPLAPGERISRQELIRLSNLYFDAIEKSDGSLVPWDPECYRFENGMLTVRVRSGDFPGQRLLSYRFSRKE